MASNTLSVDPRIINPLICSPEQGLARFARDSLNRVGYSLDLLSDLIGGSNDSSLLESENSRFALSLHLTGLASTVAALSDALAERKITLHPYEIPITLELEERSKLEVLACQREVSVSAIAAGFIKERLAGLRVEATK